MQGFVWLVGAGPGDPGLITVRGRDLLTKAEVVIYDELANRALLGHCPSGCELLYAGKRAGHHCASQAEIQALMIRRATEGRRVVRLKGGDPAIFGRLGEEAQALMEAEVPFEIVPGVTAAIAASAMAGVPLTHRAHASAVVFVTGHECPEKGGTTIDWQALAKTGATLCLYMGVRRFSAIAQELIAAGLAADTPVAVVSNATLPDQATAFGSLAGAEQLSAQAAGRPALIIVGQVVRLAPQLAAAVRHAVGAGV